MFHLQKYEINLNLPPKSPKRLTKAAATPDGIKKIEKMADYFVKMFVNMMVNQ